MNVTIQWSKGAPPVLTIYDLEGHNTSKIELADYDDKELLDKMMVEQGFRKRTEEEVEQYKQDIIRRKKRDVEAAENRRAADKRKRKELEERTRKLSNEAAGGEEAGGAKEPTEEPREPVRVIDKPHPAVKEEL